MGPLDVPTAGLMAAVAPEAIMALPRVRQSGPVSAQEHAAIVTASPLFWFRMLPVRSVLWETERAWTITSVDEVHREANAPLPPVDARDDEGGDEEQTQRERPRAFSVRRVVGPTTSVTPMRVEDLPDEQYAALHSIGKDTGMRVRMVMNVSDWAWRAYERVRPFIEGPLLAGEPDAEMPWRAENRRKKSDLLQSVTAMRLRWAKRAGVLPGGYYARLDGVVQQSAVVQRIDVVEKAFPAVFRPDVKNATHVRAIKAMVHAMDLRKPLARHTSWP